MFEGFLTESIIGRALDSGKIKIKIHDLHKWGIGKWKKVDDTPYGGGSGMVLKVDVVAKAIQDIKADYQKDKRRKSENCKIKTILLTPQGRTYNQSLAKGLATDDKDILLVCGHYEGFDERIREYVDEEISIGDYILTGGELAAAVIIDSVARLLPSVLGKESSHQEESFSIKNENLLEYPQYTRPERFEEKDVPKVLKSGNHQKIEEWRNQESIKRTNKRRPDLI